MTRATRTLVAVAILGALGAGASGAGASGAGASGAGASGAATAPRAGGTALRAGGSVGAEVPLRQQVGQLIVAGFPGTSAPAWMRRRLARRELGGVVLFGHNVRSPQQVRALDAQIQRAARGNALISLDQEGGQVRRLSWASPLRDGSLQGTPSLAYRSARSAARDLLAVGANVNLAPVADVALDSSREMRRRAFPGDAAAVSQLVRASLRGYRGTGVAPTVKHFPGFGAARANTDDVVVRINRTRAQMESTELAPFRAAIAAKTPLIMVAHAVYPAYDSRNIASQSRAIVNTLLRRQLGYDGVVATDSMEAQAVLVRSSVAVAAERSIRAGADVLLLSGSGSYAPIFNRLLATARRDARFRARIEQAYGRVAALKTRIRREAG